MGHGRQGGLQVVWVQLQEVRVQLQEVRVHLQEVWVQLQGVRVQLQVVGPVQQLGPCSWTGWIALGSDTS